MIGTVCFYGITPVLVHYIVYSEVPEAHILALTQMINSMYKKTLSLLDFITKLGVNPLKHTVCTRMCHSEFV